MNIYLEITEEFNRNGLRAIISSGQAVVLHRLAIMSKDGDWIVREEPDALRHVLTVLAGRHARYRLGAPLDARWMAGGWSSHFELQHTDMRIRADFVTRPPRINAEDLARLWASVETAFPPVVDIVRLAVLKRTNREKDYAVIGELARLMIDPRDQLLHSRSARDIHALVQRYPDIAHEAVGLRPLLAHAGESVDKLEEALDAERRTLIHENEARLERYTAAARPWADAWPAVEKCTRGMGLTEAHEFIVQQAEGILPFAPAAGEPQ